MKLFVITLTFTFIISCNDNDINSKPTTDKPVDTANFTTIKWIDSLVEVGTVPAGKAKTINFRFKNTGDKPLLVIDAKPGCGCTVADYPKEPLSPGKEGVLTAKYNVDEKSNGDFRKHIRVITNTKGKQETFIGFYGTILNEKEKKE